MNDQREQIKQYLETVLQLKACLAVLEELEESAENFFEEEAKTISTYSPAADALSGKRPEYPPEKPYPPKKPVPYNPDVSIMGKHFFRKIKLEEEAKEHNRRMEEEYAEAMRKYEEDRIRYEFSVECYNRFTEEYGQACDADRNYRRKCLECLNENARLTSDWFEEKRDNTESLLEKLLSKNVIHERYRNNDEALAFFYDCLDIGWAYRLEGPDGAYKQFEDKSEHKEITAGIAEVVKSMRELKSEQETLRRVMKNAMAQIEKGQEEMRELTGELTDRMLDAGPGTQELLALSRSMSSAMNRTAINTQLTNQNMVALELLRQWER